MAKFTAMLSSLSIRNFALVEEAEVSFGLGFTVITGETGAGKSIFLDALGLVLGGRADVTATRDKKKKCVVEAIFKSDSKTIRDLLTKNDLDASPEICIRREVSPEGKSRSFINDSPVNLTLLRSVTLHLVDIHTQFENEGLEESDFKFEWLDSLAGCRDAALAYKGLFHSLKKWTAELDQLLENEKKAKSEYEFDSFQLNEIENANLRVGESSELENAFKTLSNSEVIQSVLSQIAANIDSEEIGIATLLRKVRNQFSSLAKYDNSFAASQKRVESLLYEIQDISAEAEETSTRIRSDGQKREIIIDRLDNLNRLFKKHGAKDEEVLMAVRNRLQEKAAKSESLEHEIAVLSKKIDELKLKAGESANHLNNIRKREIPSIEKSVQKILAELNMPDAKFLAVLSMADMLNEYGKNVLQFLFSANKGSSAVEIQRVASGGERSRIMLALKAILADKLEMPTLIFDEIDTGVSGAVAHKMGKIISGLGKHRQVIAVTHLAQIAALGDAHFIVRKSSSDDSTKSELQLLDETGRVEEIAKMLSSGKPSQAARLNAKELLQKMTN